MKDTKSYIADLKESTILEVSVKQTFEQKQKGILIDIREKDEVKSGSPKGAIRVSKGLLEMQIENFIDEPEKDIYLICASGNRSVLAAKSLLDLGYKNVYSVQGGFKAWKDQGLPFELPQMLNEKALERYKRHILIPQVGEQGQLKLLNSKVLVVGAGGIGSPVAWYLAAAGIGTIGIIDDDVVDRTNLQRQILHTEDSIGEPKVDSARKRLEALNPDIKITTYNERITKENVELIFQDYDVILDGTDNFNTRYLINDACVKLEKPNVHGSVFLFEGQVTTFWPSNKEGDYPCYRCLYPSPPPAELAPSCAEAGVLGVLPGMVGVLCATEAIKIITGIGTLLTGKLLVYNALEWDFQMFDIESNHDCKYCKNTDVSAYPVYSEYAESCAM